MTPALSFGLPVFDGEKYLATALESVQHQDLENIEIVVSDNGSTDGTEEICREAARTDPRIRYLRSSVNRGGAWNFMRVAKAATSPLFSWMAADDIKLPTFASSCLAALAENGDAVLAYPQTQLIDGEGRVFENLNDGSMGLDAPSPHLRVRNLLGSQASHVTFGVIRMSALHRTRGILPVVGDDMVILVELLCQGKAVLAEGRCFWQRRHAEQFSALAEGQVRWYAPSGSLRFAFPQTRVNIELYRAAAASSLPVSEKARCWAQITSHWVLPRWRGMARDLLMAVGPVRT